MNHLTKQVLFLLFIFFLVIGCSKKEKESFNTPETYTRTMEDTAQIMVIIEEDTMKIQEIGRAPKTSELSSEEKPEPLPQISQTETDDAFPTPSQNTPYVIQVASFNNKDDADSLVRRLREKGYTAYFETFEDPTIRLKGLYYRVRIGFFQDSKEADSFGKMLKEKEKVEYWIDKR